jgi:hypothetical protein
MAKAKNPKVPVPDDLTRDELIAMTFWIRGRAYPTKGGPDPFFCELDVSKPLKREYVNQCLKWHRENNVKRVSFYDAVQKWIIIRWEDNQRKIARKKLEKPQQPRRATGKGFQPLSDTIDWIKRGEGDG